MKTSWRTYSLRARAVLRKRDKRLGELIRILDVPDIEPERNYFRSLVEIIIGQQLSGKAAETISKRFREIFGSARTFPTPAEIRVARISTMRRAGLSRSKASYIKNLAAAIEEKRLDIKRIERMGDEEIVVHLTAVKGIGPWTAEMFLMFSLARPDIFSFGDLGLRKAVRRLYGLRRDPDEMTMRRISNVWRPHRTLAARYLWASLDQKK